MPIQLILIAIMSYIRHYYITAYYNIICKIFIYASRLSLDKYTQENVDVLTVQQYTSDFAKMRVII